MGAGEAICTMHEVVAVVNRPQDIEDEEANEFLRGIRGRCRRKSGVDVLLADYAGGTDRTSDELSALASCAPREGFDASVWLKLH